MAQGPGTQVAAARTAAARTVLKAQMVARPMMAARRVGMTANLVMTAGRCPKTRAATTGTGSRQSHPNHPKGPARRATPVNTGPARCASEPAAGSVYLSALALRSRRERWTGWPSGPPSALGTLPAAPPAAHPEAADRGGGPGSGSGGGGPGGRYRGGPGPCPACGKPGSATMPVLRNLAFPLLTLLGLAERPGEAHGLGALDPSLVRDLTAAGARHPDSKFCITVTDQHGFAIGHGCCRPIRGKKASTIPIDPDRVTMARSGSTGPDGGYGSWILTLPGAPFPLIVDIDPVPTYDCDHRHESRGYQPSDKLRHLIQVRDGKCSFPACTRHARESDFEHATPFGKGGRTCGCNAHCAAAPATASSNPPAGMSPSRDPAGPAGPPRPAAPTSKDPGATQPDPGLAVRGVAALGGAVAVAEASHCLDAGIRSGRHAELAAQPQDAVLDLRRCRRGRAMPVPAASPG